MQVGRETRPISAYGKAEGLAERAVLYGCPSPAASTKKKVSDDAGDLIGLHHAW